LLPKSGVAFLVLTTGASCHANPVERAPTRSSNVGVSPPAMTNSRPMTSPSSNRQPSGSGYALMSPRPGSNPLGDHPTGKSVHCCPALREKIFWFSEDPNHLYIHRRPVPTEGRFANVTNAERDAVDAGCASDESAPCGRRSRVVLTPRRWRQVGEVFSPVTVSTSRSPGRARISRKPLRGECRVIPV
jgi:hypothetical protein